MRVLDPGHRYLLAHLDGAGESELVFVKREGDGYPGNSGHHEGTNLQDVMRVLIHRVEYLDHQIPCSENKQVLLFLRQSIFLLERRAAQRHNRWLDPQSSQGIEDLPTCVKCGHIHEGCSTLADAEPSEGGTKK